MEVVENEEPGGGIPHGEEKRREETRGREGGKNRFGGGAHEKIKNLCIKRLSDETFEIVFFFQTPRFAPFGNNGDDNDNERVLFF